VTENEKMEQFGRMVHAMMTDVLLLPAGGAYGRKTITMPDGRGGEHSLELIIARKPVADAMEEIVAMRFGVTNVPGTKDTKPV
jgi:hypothetical protein